MNNKIVSGGFKQTRSGLVVPDSRPQLPPGAKQINVPIGELMISGPSYQFHVDQYQSKISNFPGDCGIDLFPVGIEEARAVGQTWAKVVVSTGVALTFPLGSWGLMTTRANMTELLSGGWIEQGTINSGSTSLLKVKVLCHQNDLDVVQEKIRLFIVEKMALAQVVPLPFWYPTFVELDKGLIIKGRGDKGPGSTNGMKVAAGMEKPPTIIS